jgi:hypothetical protein
MLQCSLWCMGGVPLEAGLASSLAVFEEDEDATGAFRRICFRAPRPTSVPDGSRWSARGR